MRYAWRVASKQKQLWILGIFTSLITTGGAFEIFSRQLKFVFSPNDLFWQARWGVGKMFVNDYSVWFLAVILGLLLLGLFVFVVFASVRSFIALIAVGDKYEPEDKIDLTNIWSEGEGKTGEVFLAVLFFKIVIWLSMGLSILPLWFIWFSGYVGKLIWFYPALFLIGIIISLTAAFLLVLTSAFIVIKKESLGQAIFRACGLFVNNWLVCFEMAALIFLINWLVGIVAVAATLIIGIPTLMLTVVSAAYGLPALLSISVFLGTVLILLVILLTAGFMGVFFTVAWAQLFKRMTEGRAFSKLQRIVDKLTRRI